ncbi:MAG: LPS export ABC transporter periplasmic protein LptC [Chromatiales bacterium 21-64-14]|nr:MAG: LPS export ABC transporter periplasmic protein LptC [Chromatiales bacterium 21-64-14]HQU14943.1 LPS export ABC transporter periplasmic protein LptC [Gammaproteobacteria bacterium]
MEARGGPLVTLLLALAVVLTGWVLFQAQRSLEPPAPAAPHEPDYRLSTFTLRVLGPDGAVQYRLQSPSLVHYPDPDRSDLTKPRLRWYPQPGAIPWKVHAERGQVLAAGDEVRLLGTVHIDRAAEGTRRAVTIQTRDLQVWPHREVAETADLVTMRSAGATISGVGMRAYLKDGRVLLLSRVRGTYVHTDS